MKSVLSALIILTVILGITVLGFLITFIVGKLTKSNGTKQTGKIGIFIVIPLLVISLIASLSINHHLDKVSANKVLTEKKEASANKKAMKAMDKKFNKAGIKFADDLSTIGVSSEDLAQKEQKAWASAIDNSDEDFDVDAAISKIEEDNKTAIDGIELNLATLKEELDTMAKNDTGEYDYQAYEKAYKSARKLANFVTSPSGSYDSFGDTFQKLDQAVADEYSNLTDN